VFVGNDEGGVTALDAASGKRVWSQAVRAPIGNGLAILGGTTSRQAVVVAPVLAGQGTRGGVVALQATTGQVLWRDALGCGFLPAPAVGIRDGNAVVYAVGEDGSVVCLDGAGGRTIWRTVATPLHGAAGAVELHGEPVLVSSPTGDELVCGGGDGGVRCFDAASGSLLWTFEAGSAVRSRPRALSIKGADGTARDVLLVGTDGACAYAIDAHTGAPLWKCRTSGIAFATPGFYRGTVSCLTDEGILDTFKVPA
jgi:outer membrane protein assembly factor BamB